MKMDIQIKGLDEALVNVNRFDALAVEGVAGALRESGKAVRKGARAKVPVGKTGSTKKTIKMKTFDRGMTVIVSAGNFIGKFVEFGTGIYSTSPTAPKKIWVIPRPRKGKESKPVTLPNGKVVESVTVKGQRPQPFLFPAYEEESPNIKKRLAQAIRHAGEEVDV